MDTSQLKKMKRHRRMYRFIGAMFTLVGCMLLVSFVPLLLNPEATILHNGVPTSDFSTKLSATLFVGCFSVLGLFFLFCPSKYLNKLFVWRQSLMATIFPRRR